MKVLPLPWWGTARERRPVQPRLLLRVSTRRDELLLFSCQDTLNPLHKSPLVMVDDGVPKMGPFR